MRTGIRRKVDDLGRVVIPAGIRRTLGIREGDALEVHVEGEQVILAKPSDQCVFCGREEDLSQFRKRALCRSCVAGVGVLDERVRDERTQREGDTDRQSGADRRSDLPPWPVSGSPPRSRAAPRPQPAEQPPVSTPRADRHRGAEGEPGAGSDPGTGARPRAPAAQDEPPPSPDEPDDREDPPASSTAW